MSKRQEKLIARRKERYEFLASRRAQQLTMLEQLFETGDRMYQDNKEKLSEEEIAEIEKMRTEQVATLDNVREEIKTYLAGAQTGEEI